MSEDGKDRSKQTILLSTHRKLINVYFIIIVFKPALFTGWMPSGMVVPIDYNNHVRQQVSANDWEAVYDC